MSVDIFISKNIEEKHSAQLSAECFSLYSLYNQIFYPIPQLTHWHITPFCAMMLKTYQNCRCFHGPIYHANQNGHSALPCLGLSVYPPLFSRSIQKIRQYPRASNHHYLLVYLLFDLRILFNASSSSFQRKRCRHDFLTLSTGPVPVHS